MEQSVKNLELVGGGRVQTSINPWGDALNFHWPSLRLYLDREWGCLTRSDVEPEQLHQVVESSTYPHIFFSWSEVEKVEKVRVLLDYGPTVRFILSRSGGPEWFLFSTLVKRRRSVGKVLDFVEARGVHVSRDTGWQSIG